MFGQVTLADVVLGILVVAATLEAAFGYCLGCRIFAVLMRIGVIPEDVCAECNDITARYGRGVESRTDTTLKRQIGVSL